MKFKKLLIEDFKSIEALKYEPTNKTIALIGENGKGKTAFEEAIYAGITGDFPSTCIRNGTDSSTITMVLEDGTKFSRTVHATKPNKVAVNGRNTTAKALNEMLETKAGVSKEAMKTVTSSKVVDGMSSADFGTFIMSYIPEELDYDTIISYIPGITPEMEDEIHSIIPVMPTKFGLDKITETYNYFVEQRKFTKKEIAIRDAKIKSFTVPEPTRTLKEIEDDLAEIIGKEASFKSAKEAMTLYQSAVKQREISEQQIKDIKAKIDAITVTKPNPIVFDNLKAQKKDAYDNIVDARTMINAIDENIKIFNNTLVNLNKPVCPISEKLVCTTDKTCVKKELEELVESNKEGIQIQEKIIEKNEKILDDVNAKIDEYDNDLKLYNKKVLLNSQYEDLKKHLPSSPTKPAEVSSEDYSEDKKALQIERDNYRAYAQHKKDIDERTSLANKLAIYEALCKTFNAKGTVVSTIMEHYLSVFETTCNTRAKSLKPDFQMKFVVGDGITYIVKTSTSSDYKPYEALSSGEKTFVMFLILDMLNTLTGLKILMLDDLDNLDNSSFENIIELIQSNEIQDDYDHIILCAVNHDDIVNTLKKYKNIDFI